MPVVNETTVLGYASCGDPLCPGYEQQEIKVLRREVGFTYIENGADGSVPASAIENSIIGAVCVVDPAEANCSFCDKPRIAALEQRPEYPRISGQDPLALLSLNQDRHIHNVQAQGLETQIALEQTRRELAEMRAALAERDREPPRRGPGRPRKEESDR